MPCYISELTKAEHTKEWPYDQSAYLMCDTHKELWEARWFLALKPEWVQDEGKHSEHFDLTPSKHKRAVKIKKQIDATVVSLKEIATKMAEKREKMKRGEEV